MPKTLTETQDTMVNTAVDKMIEVIVDNADLDVDAALTALDQIRSRISTLRPIDVMPRG